MRLSRTTRKGGQVAKTSVGVASGTPGGGSIIVSGPSLRRMLDISAPTLWRWRRDQSAGFPRAKLINGRLYFQWEEVQAWLAKQHSAA
jgi:predicted DNA-binding transcriptional regulator AlpA